MLYLALEEKRAELRRQFKAMGATDEPIYVSCAIAPADGVALLSETVMRDPPALVIIDPIIRLSRMVDSNDYAKVSLALEPFIVMARESGAHVCLIHHSGRGDPQGVDAPMGSTAFAGSVDTILDMKRRERMRTLSSRQQYGDDLEEVVLAMDETGRITAAGGRADLDRVEAKKQLMEFSAEHSNSDQQAIRDAMEGRWAPIRDALTELIKDEIVTRTGSGKRVIRTYICLHPALKARTKIRMPIIL